MRSLGIVMRGFAAWVRETPMRPASARAIDETLRDWTFEASTARGLRRLAVNLRGALALSVVLLRTGGPNVTAGDTVWMISRIGLPLLGVTAVLAVNVGGERLDLLRLPFEYWPAFIAATGVTLLGMLPAFLPFVVLIGVLWPGPRARVPWMSAVLVFSLASAVADSLALRWAHAAVNGLHYLTFAIERGATFSPGAPMQAGAGDPLRLVLGSAVAASAMAMAAGRARRRWSTSLVTQLSIAVAAIASYCTVLLTASLLIVRLNVAGHPTAALSAWRPMLAEVLAASAVATAALAIRVDPLTPAPRDRGAAA